MTKLSLTELQALISVYVVASKIAVTNLEVTKNNIGGLADKIGKIITIDSNFKDKLAVFDDEDLSFGKTVEEYFQDLILPEEGATPGTNDEKVTKFFSPTYRPVSYSYTLGSKKFPISKPYNNIERAVHNIGQYERIVFDITKKLFDSETAWKYGVKRQMLATLISKCEDAEKNATTFAKASAYNEGAYVKDTTNYGVVVVAIKANTYNTYNDAVNAGAIINLNFITTIAKPTDTASGEAFIKQLKNDVEIAMDESEGYSLNGNTIGAVDESLYLIIKQGVMPSLEVDTQAGAFHADKVALPAKHIVVKDFGDNNTGVYAMLVDVRGLKLHNDYRAVRTFENGYNDFISYFLHTEFTAFISRNTFIKIYKSE